MSYFPIDIPPGVVRTGTEYKSKGRWYDTNYVRWFAGEMRPTGGWLVHSTSFVLGKPRALHAWRDNTGLPWLAVGTNTNLYAMTREGVLYDITPAGFTTGPEDATSGAGYGAGDYGDGLYGTPRDSAYSILPAAVWSLDNYGQYLLGVMSYDGIIYEWDLVTGTPAAALSGAPTAVSLVVTAEHAVMAFGAASDPRLVQWSDIFDRTDWTPSVTNYSRSQILATKGAIVCGLNIVGGVLVFTDTDLWLGSYLGQPSVYGFAQRGDGCGILSINAAVATGSSAYWMSTNGFWTYNGYAQPLECTVHDYVFGDFNDTQASKVFAMHISAFSEVWFYYCSAESSEIDRYVIYNYLENHWAIGQQARLAGIDRGAFVNPLMAAPNQYIYDHESGLSHGGVRPYATSGPVELGEGDRVVTVRKIIPDENSLGNVDVTFTAKFFPMGDPTDYGPYTMTANADCLFTARQAEITLTSHGLSTDFRVGKFRIEGTLGGLE